jgi:hypothetical protein
MRAIAKRSVGIAFLMLWIVECDSEALRRNRISDVVGFESARISDVVDCGGNYCYNYEGG